MAQSLVYRAFWRENSIPSVSVNQVSSAITHYDSVKRFMIVQKFEMTEIL